ncbi:MAG: ASKHA domain-containing protein [Anaerolineales bacterium]
MAEHTVRFDTAAAPVKVPTGTLLSEAARLAGVEIGQPCGGQGRCGRCLVQVPAGGIRRRSTLRLSAEDALAGYALACQSIVEADVSVIVPPQEKIERRLTTDRTAVEVAVPAGYDAHTHQTVRRYPLSLNPPSMDDQTDDWSRVQIGLRQQHALNQVQISLAVLRELGAALRAGDWQVTLVVDTGDPDATGSLPRLIAVFPGLIPADQPLWGGAVDIGTTTVTLWLADLITGKVHAQLAEYNQQITRGEDVISRIIFSSKNNGRQELQNLVLETINGLIEKACLRTRLDPREIFKLTIAGNSTMMHLLLGIPAESIRLSPFITTVNQPPPLRAAELGLGVHPEAVVDCLPGVASYVGADITAGVLSSGVDDTEDICLFLDVGTNGEIALGSREWLVACACSAGPAFEGAGVQDGMRATRGAIEEVWINTSTYAPTCRVIGGVAPRGLCGSGLISLLAEMFLTGIVDKGGNFDQTRPTDRVRVGDHGPEYVIVWADETQHKRDIVITHVDVDNLLRAKAAIFAGFSILSSSVGVPLEMAEKVLIGGSFGKYINVEKAVQIGLLPDKPWEQFHFLGNTSVQGAYLTLLDKNARARIADIAARMTYIELSADNSFYEAFTSALFLPHTDLSQFPTVAQELNKLAAPVGVQAEPE